jgi:hypothetical protein
VTQDDIIAYMAGIPDVEVLTAGPENGAPESAWGDVFFSIAGIPAEQGFPFATIVVSDYEGFDTFSDLNRAGVFRLKISVGRRRFQELFGYGPELQPAHAGEYDYAASDVLMPHPVYATQGWASIVNPGERTDEQARQLLTSARERELRRLRR